MSALSEKWNKTKNIYLNWLINTDLKKIFQKIFIIKNCLYGG